MTATPDRDPAPSAPIRGRHRARWAAIGAAVAVTFGAGGIGIAGATIGTGAKPVFVAITPCRLVDTRPAPTTVGTRATPLQPGEVATFAVHGANGNCTIPADAVAVAANVTITDPTSDSFLTVAPADQPLPNASNLNWADGQLPTPNAVIVDLAADGRIQVFNERGTVNLIVDVVGYYDDHHHDDRYYTKAEIDAVAGPHRRSVSFPAQGLNVHSYGAATRNDGGIRWMNDYVGGAVLSITRPDDFAGTGTVDLTITYYRTTGAAGNLQFFTRPQDWDPGQSLFDNQDSVSGPIEATAGVEIIQQTTITWPAADEVQPIWNVSIQRNSQVANAYPDPVVVKSVTLSYDATR